MFLPLSRGNLAALKNALIDEFPDISSSHTDEIVAYALGFRTYASMRPLLSSDSGKDKPVLTILFDRLAERAEELGYELPKRRIWGVVGRCHLPDGESMPFTSLMRDLSTAANEN